MKFQEGNIFIANLQQADGLWKQRPVLVLRILPAPYYDILICGISTNLQQEIIGFDEQIAFTDSDFSVSHLKQTSVIRLSFVGTVAVSDVVGRIGRISPERHQRLLRTFTRYLLLSS
ncbi:MAG: type II toxin-antitoxin system PemK/MazF family toxin [Candidatus Kapaibacteriota bacterium]